MQPASTHLFRTRRCVDIRQRMEIHILKVSSITLCTLIWQLYDYFHLGSEIMLDFEPVELTKFAIMICCSDSLPRSYDKREPGNKASLVYSWFRRKDSLYQKKVLRITGSLNQWRVAKLHEKATHVCMATPLSS